jgi:hypothetical protein
VDVDIPLYWNVKVCHVVQDEVDELLVAFFAHVFDKRLGLKLFTQPIRRQAILCKCKVEIVDDWNARWAVRIIRLCQTGARQLTLTIISPDTELLCDLDEI